MEETQHLVIFPLPVFGHITPMLHFGVARASEGKRVTFITTSSTHNRVLRLVAASSSNSPPSLMFASLELPDDSGDLDPRPGEVNGMDEVLQTIVLMSSLKDEFARLMLRIQTESSITCFVSDFLLGWTAAIAADLRVPRAAFWTASATFLLTVHYIPELLAAGCIPLKGSEAGDAAIPKLEGLPKLLARDLPYSMQTESPYDPGFRFCLEGTRMNLCSDSVLANTCRELEPEAVDAMQKICKHFAAVGPLLPLSPSAELDDDRHQALKWLDNQAPSSVLYVSFGSVARLEPEQLEELVSGIENSKVPFLWVFRNNLVKDGKVHGLMAMFKCRTAGKGIVVDWVPQLEVLRHSSVGGFLTHCGWNSVLESMASGVPMLGWPCMAEQNLNLWFVEKWGCGFGLTKVKRKEI